MPMGWRRNTRLGAKAAGGAPEHRRYQSAAAASPINQSIGGASRAGQAAAHLDALSRDALSSLALGAKADGRLKSTHLLLQ